MAKVIGFVSEKGGVGKTTAVYHIAIALQRYHNSRVLLLDTDYQRGGLTCRLMPEMLENFRVGEMDDTTLYVVYRALYTELAELPELTVRTTSSGIDLIPGDPRLNAISVDKMPAPRNLREGNKMLLRHLTLVSEALSSLAHSYDYVLIDSHPDLHDLERAVIAASDYLLSPVKLDNQSSVGVASTIEAMNGVNEDISTSITFIDGSSEYNQTCFAGAVGMMCREYGASLKYSEQLIFNRLSRTAKMFNSYVTEGDGLRQATQNSCPVFDLNFPNAMKQSAQFKALTRELVAHAT